MATPIESRVPLSLVQESPLVNGVAPLRLLEMYLINNPMQFQWLLTQNGILIGLDQGVESFQQRAIEYIVDRYKAQGSNANMWLWNNYLSKLGTPTALGMFEPEIKEAMAKMLEVLVRSSQPKTA